MKIREDDLMKIYNKAAVKLLFSNQESHNSMWMNVFSCMLFPDKKSKRLSWLIHKGLRNVAIELQAQMSTNVLGADQIACDKFGKEVAALAALAGGPLKFCENWGDPKAQLPDLRKRIDNGCMVGRILLIAIENRIRLKKAVNHYLSLEGEVKDKGEDHIKKNILPAFAPVAHFWAAYVYLLFHNCIDTKETDVDAMLACDIRRSQGKVDGLAGFFKISDAYLFDAINLIPQGYGPRISLLDIEKMVVAIHPFHDFSDIIVPPKSVV